MAPPSEDALLDWQEQVDEVQALEAIYGDDFRLAAASDVLPAEGRGDANGDAASSSSGRGTEPLDAATLAVLDAPASDSWQLDCSLLVRPELPAGGLRLQLPHDEGGGGGGEPGASSGSGGYRAEHLPPLCMQLRLAAGYPSRQPPQLSLSAAWLSGGASQQLQEQLQALWEEQGPGIPVCYAWADWLQGGVLRQLAPGGSLQLGAPPSGGGAGSEQAGQQSGQQQAAGSDGGQVEGGAWQAEDTLMMLLRYNAVQEHQAFHVSMHTCGVCLEEQPGRQFTRLDCRHAWCSSCLGAQASLAVAEGGLERLRCPDPQCKAPLPPSALQRLLTAEEFARWEQLTLQRTLDSMPDAAYCPRCSTISIEDADSCAQCPKCFFVFCSLCNEGWHPGTTCVSAETKLAMLRRKMEGGGRAALEDLRRQEQELLSVAQIEKTAKKCPRCGMATEKAEGCNKMSCGGCGAYWCWRCGKEIDGYKHFRSGDCILFDEAEILRWEAQWDEMQAAARIAAAGMRNDFMAETVARAGGRPRGCFCPQCGQVNHKIAQNNHISCWSCGGHFCAQCHAVLRGKGAGASHFGPRGCKQHSPD